MASVSIFNHRKSNLWVTLRMGNPNKVRVLSVLACFLPRAHQHNFTKVGVFHFSTPSWAEAPASHGCRFGTQLSPRRQRRPAASLPPRAPRCPFPSEAALGLPGRSPGRCGRTGDAPRPANTGLSNPTRPPRRHRPARPAWAAPRPPAAPRPGRAGRVPSGREAR